MCRKPFNTGCESAAYGYFGRCWDVNSELKATISKECCKNAGDCSSNGRPLSPTCDAKSSALGAEGVNKTCPEAFEDFYFKCRIQIEEKASASDKDWYQKYLQTCQVRTSEIVRIPPNPCATSPCKNGKCVNVKAENGAGVALEEFNCDCDSGYVGKLCDTHYNKSAGARLRQPALCPELRRNAAQCAALCC